MSGALDGRPVSGYGRFVITCPNCRSELLADPGARLVHHDDGTHTFIPATGEAKTNE